MCINMENLIYFQNPELVSGNPGTNFCTTFKTIIRFKIDGNLQT